MVIIIIIIVMFVIWTYCGFVGGFCFDHRGTMFAGYVACHTATLLVAVLTQCRCHGNAGFSQCVFAECVCGGLVLTVNQSVSHKK